MEYTIETDRLILKILDGSYSHQVADFLRRGRDLFEKYEAAKPEIYYTDMFQKNVLDNEYSAILSRRYLRYYVFKNNNPNIIIGTVSFGNVSDSPYHSSTIGYKFDPFFHHQGFALEAINATLKPAADYLRLHRLMAYIMPENEASIRLIESAGFSKEGLMKKSIKIKGQWEDHYLYALLTDDK